MERAQRHTSLKCCRFSDWAIYKMFRYIPRYSTLPVCQRKTCGHGESLDAMPSGHDPARCLGGGFLHCVCNEARGAAVRAAMLLQRSLAAVHLCGCWCALLGTCGSTQNWLRGHSQACVVTRQASGERVAAPAPPLRRLGGKLAVGAPTCTRPSTGAGSTGRRPTGTPPSREEAGGTGRRLQSTTGRCRARRRKAAPSSRPPAAPT